MRGPRTGGAYIDWRGDKCLLLAANPRLGPARPDTAPDCRHFPVGRYLILYRLIPHGIEAVRVVQGSRRLEDLFPGA
jgi:toxin ParE1/3/4